MKNLLKKRIKLLCVTAVLVSFTFSCTKDDPESNSLTIEETNSIDKVDPNDPVVKTLVGKGWNIDKIEKLSNGDYVIGDVLFSGKIEDYTISKQARETLVDDYRNISVFIHSSVAQEDNTNTNAPNEDNWTDATKNAMTIWNSVPDSGLQFTQAATIQEADIIVLSDFGLLGDPTVAIGSFPEDGNAGKTIFVNLDFSNDQSLEYDVRLNNMVHELGHNIGFRHTNWRGLGEGSDNLVAIPGTPNTGNDPDPSSVMNGATALNGFAGLSVNDKKAVAFLYPN